MELRVDRLLAALRHRPGEVLQAIDSDPLLMKKHSGPLVLANASKALFTPQQEHQLYAKGIVYRRDPYQLVSLPLLKIYNLGERDVTVDVLASLAADATLRLHFLRKIDGSLIQVFHHDGRVWFTTRGKLEGDAEQPEPDEEDGNFDYIGTARRLAAERYPRLLDPDGPVRDRTLLFELIHPQARKITDYGDRDDLILLACFDHVRIAYWPYPEVAALGACHGLTTVDALTPAGNTLAERIDNLLEVLGGTDQEGSVLQFEHDSEVVYRVKVKSPSYLRLMRLLVDCTYEKTAALLDANPHIDTWKAFEALLQEQGRDIVPEEVLTFYRQHRERYLSYLDDCERLRRLVESVYRELAARLGDRSGQPPAAYRKAFAALALTQPFSKLLFSALDGRLDIAMIRKLMPSEEEVRAALEKLQEKKG